MKCFYSNGLIKLDSFYDQHIEVTLSESIHLFRTKDIYVKQKAMFIISYIYQEVIVKENCSYSYQKVLFVIELQIQQKVMFIIFLRVIYLKTFIRIFYIVIILYLSEIYLCIYLLIYLFISFFISFILFYLFCHIIYSINYIVYRKEQVKIREKVEKRLKENMIKSAKLLKRSVTYKFI